MSTRVIEQLRRCRDAIPREHWEILMVLAHFARHDGVIPSGVVEGFEDGRLRLSFDNWGRRAIVRDVAGRLVADIELDEPLEAVIPPPAGERVRLPGLP